MYWLYRLLGIFLLCAGVPSVGQADDTISSIVHQVKRGDTLSEIARRYRVSEEQLRQWNGLQSDRIFVGQRLVLWPRDAASEVHLVGAGDTLSRLALRYGVPLAELRRLNDLTSDTIRPGQQLKLRSPLSEAQVHEVRSGDTLSALALRYGTTIGRLKALNDLSGNTIHPGQRLSVADRKVDDEEVPPLEYIVRGGDTLSGIARRFEVGLHLLRQLNGLTSDTIYPGQRLRLRPTALEEGAHTVQRGETLSGIARRYGISQEDLRRLNDIAGSKILIGQKLRLRATPKAAHIVERGDALWEIARAYGTTVEELKQLNELTSDRIYPGQELKLNVGAAVRYDTYIVRRGDYLEQIARLHQMSVAELRQLNGLRGSVIHPGDRLKVRPLLGRNWLKPSEIDWPALLSLDGIPRFEADNGPYFFHKPRARTQQGKQYFENPTASPLATYRQARRLWDAFDRQVDKAGRLSDALNGWHMVLDPGHGGLDPGAIVTTVDGDGNTLYIVENEFMYDVAVRVYVLLRLHGARVTMTVLSPNHLFRQNHPPTQTFVNEKNEVYNSLEHNRSNQARTWPSGNNLNVRVNIARTAFASAPRGRRIFLSFHSDVEPRAPEAPLVLYYESRDGRRQDLVSRSFARALLPALGAGARTRGQALGVLRNNPADYKVLLELRNMAYRDHVWALRFEELRQRDAEKIVKGLLDLATGAALSASR